MSEKVFNIHNVGPLPSVHGGKPITESRTSGLVPLALSEALILYAASTAALRAQADAINNLVELLRTEDVVLPAVTVASVSIPLSFPGE